MSDKCYKCGEIAELKQHEEVGLCPKCSEPAAPTGLGVNRAGDAILCYGYAETDRSCVTLAKSAEQVRRFLIEQCFGDDKDQMLQEWMQEIAEHDWREDREMKWEFEIGGIGLEDVFDVTPNDRTEP